MPFGTRKIDAFRTLTTESLSVFIPFRVQDIFHENGIYYGQNVISKNMIIADRRQLLNGNSFILGVSGGGKSFATKGEIENIILSSDADVIIIDPEREYSQLVKALGGEIINISATSPSHINAMDMNKEYGDGANSSRVYYRQLINADIFYILGTSISPNIAIFASFSKLLVAN